MSNLKNLSRLLQLAKQKVDIKRLHLLKLEGQHYEYQFKINKLKEEMQFEKEAVSNLHPSSMTLKNYLEVCKKKIKAGEEQQADLQPRIDVARIDLQNEYKDMKIIQTLFNVKIEEFKEIEKKKEQRNLDEIAQNMRIEKRL